MIYTEQTIKAIRLAYIAHEGQFDKSGIPYILHPIHLAENCTSEETTIVALLHDVVEDTDYTIEDLKKEGFSDTIIEAVNLLTHKKNIPYLDYIEKLKVNPIARAVKILDIKHNLDDSRLCMVSDDKLWERINKKKGTYLEALNILENY